MTTKQVPEQTVTDECRENRVFYVEGWGEAGYANLMFFAPFAGFKQISSLGVDESTEGKFSGPMSDKKPERITRRK